MSWLSITGHPSRTGRGGMVPFIGRALGAKRAFVLAILGLLAWRMAAGHGGTPDPAASSSHPAHGAVVIDSAILVLREGLETILVLAAITASFRGDHRRMRRPVAAGGAVAFAAAVGTWFLAIAVTSAAG